jgi:hypothetical protein
MTTKMTGLLLTVVVGLASGARCEAAAQLAPANTKAGYLARLLINEAPFPGERGWLSETDTKATMMSILWVLHARLVHIPAGYRQEHIAAVRTDDIIDLITVGGPKGQCDGFYRDSGGDFKAVNRVHDRIDYLMKVANKGTPGKFARLLNYAQGLADAYEQHGLAGADRFARLSRVGPLPVTGRAYSWMTDKDYYNPGGNFVKIPDAKQGSLGGNRFFTLKKQ